MDIIYLYHPFYIYLLGVTMESYHGAKINELVGPYFLNRLSTVIDKSNVGLYKNDGFVATNNANGPTINRIRKDITGYFKEKGLSITIKKILSKQIF